MSSHIHLIISSQENELQDIIRDFKKHTSKGFIKEIKELLESRRECLLATSKKIAQCIHYNPVASELVYHERDWKNSSYAIYEEDNPEKN
ncbi:hypothetical protein [Cellulophaga baltica]|uniref:hypothetical protein n=1 Tax=Cellulophaga baltica TaxID=76594 RepID=UPI001F1AAFA5|nr:hypothetical protein [Cellulophaga baltica]